MNLVFKLFSVFLVFFLLDNLYKLLFRFRYGVAIVLSSKPGRNSILGVCAFDGQAWRKSQLQCRHVDAVNIHDAPWCETTVASKRLDRLGLDREFASSFVVTCAFLFFLARQAGDESIAQIQQELP